MTNNVIRCFVRARVTGRRRPANLLVICAVLGGTALSLQILPDHKMSVAEVRTEVEPEGFTFDRLIPDLPRQHIIVFRKPAR